MNGRTDEASLQGILDRIGLGKKKKKSQQWFEKLADQISEMGWILDKGEKFQAAFKQSTAEKDRYKLNAGQKLIVNVNLVDKKRMYSARTFTGQAGPSYVYGRGNVRGDACVIQSDSDLTYPEIREFITSSTSGSKFSEFYYWCDAVEKNISVGGIREFRSYMKGSTKKVSFEVIASDGVSAAVKNVSASDDAASIAKQLAESIKSARAKKTGDEDPTMESWVRNDPVRSNADDLSALAYKDIDEEIRMTAEMYGYSIESEFHGTNKTSDPNAFGRALSSIGFHVDSKTESDYWANWYLTLISNGNKHELEIESSEPPRLYWSYTVKDMNGSILHGENNYSSRDNYDKPHAIDMIERLGRKYGSQQPTPAEPRETAIPESAFKDALNEDLNRRDEASTLLIKWIDDNDLELMWSQYRIADWASMTAVVASPKEHKEIFLIWTEPHEKKSWFSLAMFSGKGVGDGWKWYGTGEEHSGMPTQEDFKREGAEMFTWRKGDDDVTMPNRLTGHL